MSQSKKIKLLAGIPDDNNRDYLPDRLKESKIIVNENGNNSQVYPKRLKEYKKYLTDGVEDIWYEYVPISYDSSKKTPLVVSMHGGLMTGWGQAVYSSWTLVADREGFIVIFPNAWKDRVWMMECDWEKVQEHSADMPPSVPTLHKPDRQVENYHDVKKTAALINLMKQKYNIDSSRVYMQGMSMGDAMTSQFARYMGHLLTGAAGSGCPTNTKLLFNENKDIINESGPLDIWQSRLELDKIPPHYQEGDRATVLGNCQYWNKVNEVKMIPQICIRGDYNFAFFEGEKGCTVLMDVKNRDHGQTFDDAELVWDYLFSGSYRDENGILRHKTPDQKRQGDDTGIAVAENCGRAWVSNKIVELNGLVFLWKKLKYHGLNGEAEVRGEYIYVPVRFLADVFLIRFAGSEDGETAELELKNKTVIQFARGNISCVVDNRIEAMYCEAVERDHVLYISMDWFVKRFYRMHTSFCNGVLYATDHHSSISKYMSYLLQDILTEEKK